MTLRLSGQDKKGNPWETLVSTQNLSRGGFLCSSTVPLNDVETVEVCLCGEKEYNLGRARLVRLVETSDHGRSYGFQFIDRDSAEAESEKIAASKL